MNKAGEYIEFKDFVHNFYEFNIKTDQELEKICMDIRELESQNLAIQEKIPMEEQTEYYT